MSLTGLTVLLVAIGVLTVSALIGLVVVVLLDRETEPSPPAQKSPTSVRAVTRSAGSPAGMTAHKKVAATSAAGKQISPTPSAGASVVKKSATPAAGKKASPTVLKKVGVPNKVVAAKGETTAASRNPPPTATKKAAVPKQVKPQKGLTQMPPERPVRGWYADPSDSSGQRYWNGTEWTEYRKTPQGGVLTPAATAPQAMRSGGFKAFWLGLSDAGRGWIVIGAIATLAMVGLLVAFALGTQRGPSESYLWGKRAGNSAVTMVTNGGLEPSKACDTMLVAGAMWADNPVLNPTPPPKDFNRADAKRGWLDHLHTGLGY